MHFAACRTARDLGAFFSGDWMLTVGPTLHHTGQQQQYGGQQYGGQQYGGQQPYGGQQGYGGQQQGYYVSICVVPAARLKMSNLSAPFRLPASSTTTASIRATWLLPAGSTPARLRSAASAEGRRCGGWRRLLRLLGRSLPVLLRRRDVPGLHVLDALLAYAPRAFFRQPANLSRCSSLLSSFSSDLFHLLLRQGQCA
ncbi:hypothetical protein FA10DRAFT_11044 [Acaromyces ingoldii]|uniref:Uncharacterized protein n=1 Tax=Acaromyces ingoldii TaxID=215250 RepID=A0A316YUL0_9BASI|nr:hypothetical protein FA10DRAFT_11044 [Acaromyces ingoldii]PWN92959.1 hypothetical protein FA10DRAFT_11044 [Acaromyces ingoldii]